MGVTNPQVIKQNIKEANTEKVPIILELLWTRSDFELMKDISAETKSIARRIYERSDAAIQLEDFSLMRLPTCFRDLSDADGMLVLKR